MCVRVWGGGGFEESTKTSQSAGSGNVSAALVVVIATHLSSIHTTLHRFTQIGKKQTITISKCIICRAECSVLLTKSRPRSFSANRTIILPVSVF